MLKSSATQRELRPNSSNFIQRLSKFARSKSGNVAMMFGVCMVPIVLSAAVAVDLSRALIVRERLGQALDAAALAVGGNNGLSEQEQQNLADNFFAANYPAAELGVPGAINVSAGESTVHLTASAAVPTTLMKIFHYDSLTVNAETEVTKENKGLEVVMVLDNTGSMSGSKIDSLKTAAEDMVDILFGPAEAPDLLKIGMVPFGAAVNVGTDSLGQGFIDEDAQSSIAGENFTVGVNVLDLYDQIPNRSWNGCVETRREPFDVRDKKADAGNPDTLWLPYFAPDEPDTGSYDNDYLNDEISGNYDVRQRNHLKYDGSGASSGEGPLEGCTVTPITALTNDKEVLLDAIDAMGANGTTHIPIGIAWGWRVLSKKLPFTEGVGYANEDWQKAMVVLTDGANYVSTESNHNESIYTAYGYVANGRMGTTDPDQAVDKLNEKTTEVCDRVKNKEIRVYTITFQVSDDDIRDLMRDCATEDALYFDSPSEEDLQATFQAIAKDLSNLRLSM